MLVAALLASCSPAAEAPTASQTAPSAADEGAPAALQPEGDGEETNLDVWLERLEVNSRELFSARNAVVAAAGLKEGDFIADVGAGTGLYTLLFAEQVGSQGRVFAEDIEPLFLDLINRRAADLLLGNVTAVLGREDNVTLPAALVDVAFIADSYHYFDDREAVMRSIFDAVKAGGRLIMVEYDVTPGEARPEGKEYVRFGKSAVIAEVEFVGFALEDEVAVDGLEENYFLIFRKPAE